MTSQLTPQCMLCTCVDVIIPHVLLPAAVFLLLLHLPVFLLTHNINTCRDGMVLNKGLQAIDNSRTSPKQTSCIRAYISVGNGCYNVDLPLTFVIRAHMSCYSNSHYDCIMGVVTSHAKCCACDEVHRVQRRPFGVSRGVMKRRGAS